MTNPKVVTISATYGAGATRIGPALAERLGLPFLNRMVTSEVAGAAVAPMAPGEGLGPDERPEPLLRRVMDALAKLPAVFGTTMPQPEEALNDTLRMQQVVEAELCAIATTTGGVIFGRGATQLLWGRPNVLHVRLDGPVDRRVAQAARLLDIDEDEARRQLDMTDRVRAHYVQTLYGADPGDPRLYHLILDTTAVDLEAAVDTVAVTADAFWRRQLQPAR